MKIGDVYLIANPKPDKKHYHFVVSDVVDSNMLVLVFMSTIKDGIDYDDACVLSPGEMDFIVSDSYIVYEHVYFADNDDFENRINIGAVKYKGHASDAIMRRIKQGASESRRIRPAFIKYFG